MRIRIFILLTVFVIVVSVSGCNGGGETETDIESTDLLEIVDVDVIPSDTVKPGTVMTVRLEVRNVGKTDVFMVVDKDSGSSNIGEGDMVLVNYCAGLYGEGGVDFKIISKSGDGCDELPEDSELKVELGDVLIDPCYLEFQPQQSHVFQWKIRAPGPDKIKKLASECTFNFQTIYAAEAQTVTYVYFVSPMELEQRIYTKDDLTLVGDNIATYGPVAANFETGEPQPIRAKSGEDTWTVYLNLKNLGSGVAKVHGVSLAVPDDSGFGKFVSVDPDDVTCEFLDEGFFLTRAGIGDVLGEPPTGGELGSGSKLYGDNGDECLRSLSAEATDAEEKKCERKGCGYLTLIPRKTCDRYEMLLSKLEIFKTKSSRIGCTLTVPRGVTIMKPYRFVTTASYSYSIAENLKVKTDPRP